MRRTCRRCGCWQEEGIEIGRNCARCRDEARAEAYQRRLSRQNDRYAERMSRRAGTSPAGSAGKRRRTLPAGRNA